MGAHSRGRGPGPGATSLLLALWLAPGALGGPGGDFTAGSFILTQKALSEAPFRYSRFLTVALEKMELMDPPRKADEENCNVKYRIEPSGRRHMIKPRDHTLKIRLQDNNTVVISAKLDVAVHAKTWIWKGVNFGFLGCMKMTSCGGQEVKYSAAIDMQVSFEVNWNDTSKKIAVNIRPVNTNLYDVRVLGCRPPWYLWWFKSWQEMLNAGVQGAFQEFADTYSHSLTVPTVMALHNNTFISYKVTNLIWSEHFVAFEATSTFKALINGRNETYIPNEKNRTEADERLTIPSGQWPATSASDHSSHLLQGIRLSGAFLNAMMWYANKTRATEYHGNTTVLDSQVNGTINYAPPFLKVSEAGVLNISIARGELLATCKPTNEELPTRKLFDVKFENLMGSGRIRVVPADNRTCVTGEIVELDLSKLKTTPFEPKLPLPKSFESELMKTGIRQLEPLINQYLLSKPLCLPQDIEPLVAYPEVFLNQTRDGLGYVQILSYCTCSDFQAPGSFSKCDDRSRLCKPPANLRRKRSSQQEILSGKISSGGNEMDQRISEETDNVELPKFVQFLNKSTAFHTVADWVNDKLDDIIFDKNKTEAEEDDEVMINWSEPAGPRQSDFDPDSEIMLIQFETSTDCSLKYTGDKSLIYRLTPKSYCSEILVGDRKSTGLFYVFKPDGSSLNFGCSKHCKDCIFQDVKIAEKDVCVAQPNSGMSFVATKNENLIKEKLSKTNGTGAITLFFDNLNSCKLRHFKGTAEWLATTYQLGQEDRGCVAMRNGDGFLDVMSSADSDLSVSRVNLKLECKANISLTGKYVCHTCQYKFTSPKQGECRQYPGDATTLVEYFKSPIKPGVQENSQEAIAVEADTKFLIMLVVILSSSLVILCLSIAACVWCLQTGKGGNKRIKTFWEKIKQNLASTKRHLLKFLRTHFGIRVLSWRNTERSNIFEDVVQNIFLVTNGVCAILFAFEWNSPNNPLLLFNTKVSSKMGFGNKILDVSPIQTFTSKLNFWTYAVNIANGVAAFLLVILWCFTKTGSRQRWTKLRLTSAISMLSTILLTIACVVFTTYFDELVTLKENTGFFITDNEKMSNISRQVVQMSMNGLSLTVMSFTIVFLFHGVGGGLYSGTVLFRILHLYSRKENLEILTTLLVILTIIQPFICLHPVIIWSQDSNHNSKYLILTIGIWFLPLLIHLLMKLIMTCVNSRYKDKANKIDDKEESIPLKTKRTNSKKESSYSGLPVQNRKEEAKPTASETPKKVMAVIDVVIQVTQLVIFLTAFSFITHHIIYTELVDKKQNLKNFVLPAIISVFMWMMSISYYSLDLVLNATSEVTPLVFQDNAKKQLQASLRKRLVLMEKRSTLGTVRNRVPRPSQPPPPPPPQSKSEQMPPTKTVGRKSHSLPPLPTMATLKGKNQILPGLGEPGVSVRIKIKEIDEVNSDTDTENSPGRTSQNLDKTVGSVDFEYMEGYWNNSNCFRRVTNFIFESQEYKYPKTHGWRIKFRRICLILGVLGFTYTTGDTILSTQNFSSKAEIQKIINLVGTNLTWPEEGSALDDVFKLYNSTQQNKGYVMIAASILFWLSLIMDWTSYWTVDSRRMVKSLCVLASRILSFLGSLLVFASVILVGLPNYLEASNLDTICPYCGNDFNAMVRQVAEFSIGLFFACLFTFQLLPVLMTIAPALVRASILILFHPEFQKEDQTTVLQMRILQQVTIFSSLLSFPITFVSMCILDQYQKSLVISTLIILFWIVPPLVLYIGMTIAKRLKINGRVFLLFVYYTYNFVYLALVISLIVVSFGGNFQKFIQIVKDLLVEPAVWFGTMAQVFLCNVVISDLLYMTVF